jgi:hypothetical protein
MGSYSLISKNLFERLKANNVAYKYLWGRPLQIADIRKPIHLETGSLIFSGNKPPAAD